ncbi:MAG: tRNA (adenosine(37)-N6)-threonylcarbamoyltransferase complex transferase subunit TsaD [Ruminococcaceae bacterium]|nr:tRNA (adenosine(37)-N6)-threonylcarbamoyltransferase complex transferase subunit TsaD [Oscillospiraceae bacterium]
MKILSIESSCDETAAAITENGRTVLAETVYSQIALHAEYGGVVPELASRRHIETIAQTVDSAFLKSGLKKSEIDAVAVSCAPGLIGALLTGLSFAKSVSFALGKPLIPVHHIRGHIAANYLAFPELEPPFVCLVASGGNTLFVDVRDYCDIRVLGATRDDAAGEAFDKVARVLGYPYPGGKELDQLARTTDSIGSLKLPRPAFADAPLDCSFSGLKTAVINLVHNSKARGDSFDHAELARAVCECVAEMLSSRLLLAAKECGRQKIAICGGVAANSFLREAVTALGPKHGLSVYLPPASLCGDNAAMIGCAGYYAYQNGETAGLDLNAYATMEVSERFADL